jgi:precorrin-2 dehydrogenase
MASLFPMFVKVEGRRCLLIGAGKIATEKLASLLEAGANVRVIAPEASDKIAELARAGRIESAATGFQPEHLEGAFLVVAATGDPAVNEQVFRAARERGVLCNSVDEPERCDFFYPAVVRRGDLQIAISTAGKSPALAQRIRKELEEQFDSSYERWLEWLGTVRQLFFRRNVAPELRKQALHHIAGRAVFDRYKSSLARLQGGQRG